VGWRAIFYVNVPIGIIGGIAAHFVLPRYHPTVQQKKIDYTGIVLFTLALMGVALAVNHAQISGWGSTLVGCEAAAGLACLALFVRAERRTHSPMIDLSLFHHYRLIAGNATAFLAYYALFAVLFLLPFYFEQVLGYSTLHSGVMPVPASMAVLAPFAGAASNRFGSRNLTLAGSIMLTIGCFMLIFTSATGSPALLVAAMVILGAGLGIFTPANNRATMAATPRDKLGVMGGLLNMMRSAGLIFGIDISGMLFVMLANTDTTSTNLPHRAGNALAFLSTPAFMEGFHGVMISLAAVALLSAIMCWFRRHEGMIQTVPAHGESLELM